MNLSNINQFNEEQILNHSAKTGILVDIQNIGRNKKLLAVREGFSKLRIRQGVWLKKGFVNLGSGNFSNYYDFYWDCEQSDISPFIYSSNKPFFLMDQAISDPEIIGVINGAFYFLTDIADRYPLDLQYDLCIRENYIKGLPSSDQPIAYTIANKLNFRYANARGIIKIGDHILNWIGSRSKECSTEGSTALLYNSKCAYINRFREPENNIQIGVLDSEKITTPRDSQATDLVITSDKKGELKIARIIKGGGTHFFEGLFILQLKSNGRKFHTNDLVKPFTLDNLDLDKITDAITIGRSVFDKFYLSPRRKFIRDARSIIARDEKNNIHFVVFDGSKYVPGFRGITTQEVFQFFSRNKFKDAYFLDGGGSSRLIVRDTINLNNFANEFAFRKLENGKFLWDWKRARLITSFIALKILSKKQS